MKAQLLQAWFLLFTAANCRPAAGPESASGANGAAAAATTRNASPLAPTRAVQGAKPIESAHRPAAQAPEPDQRRDSPRFDAFEFERVLAQPIHSVALGKANKVAALAETPFTFDGETWTKRELTERQQAKTGDRDSLEIFFGRDNQPRLMGLRTSTGSPPKAIYWRHFPSGWRADPAELGPLANTGGGLYGLLGFDDPEVVCAPKVFCLVKRISGWARVPADDEPQRMFLTSAGVYKARDDRLLLLDNGDWKPVAGLEAEVVSACHEDASRLWVVAKRRGAGNKGQVLRGDLERATFVDVDVPLESPSALYCAGSGSIWLVGAKGAAHFDGQTWQRVKGEFGALTLVTGRGDDEIWFGGERGLFLGKPKPAP